MDTRHILLVLSFISCTFAHYHSSSNVRFNTRFQHRSGLPYHQHDPRPTITNRKTWTVSYRPVPPSPDKNQWRPTATHHHGSWTPGHHHIPLPPLFGGSFAAGHTRTHWSFSDHNRNTNLPDNDLRKDTESRSGNVSLVFVLDSTGSMHNEIRQVREGIKKIFNTILENKEAYVRNFVLALFNDPLVGPILVTTDPRMFIRQLEEIRVHGGGDCNERSLKGLQLAIARSLPNSYIFVFTDAGAKDYDLLPELETLIQKKKSQVIFVLTGDCNGHDNPGYQAYEHIATMSFGQIFNLWKDEVHKVIEYVNHTIHERNKVNIMSDEVPGSGNKTYTVPIDSNTDSLTVSVSGDNPVISMEDPVGNEIEGKPVLDVHTGLVINVIEPDPGKWSVNVGSSSDHHVVMSGSSEFSFSYAFSNSAKDILKAASMQPEVGIETLLVVKITNQSQLYNLTTVKLRTHQQQIIKSLDLFRIKGHPDLYMTSKFMPPNKQFYIEVHGIDNKGFTLERISQTAINPKTPVGLLPIVQTLSSMKLYSGFMQEIWCHVESKTNYTVSWKKNSKNGIYIPVIGSRFSVKKTGNLIINPVIKEDDGWYQCIAENEVGKAEKQVLVEVEGQLHVKVTPRKMYFMQGETVNISCEFEGHGSLTLEWRKNGKLITPSDTRLEIHNKNSFNIRLINANQSDEGRYECIAKGVASQDIASAEVVYVEYPYVNRTATHNILSLENTTVIINCSIQGKPKPTITWLKDGRKIKPDHLHKVLPGGDLLILNTQMSSAGAFTCIGKNSLGQVHQTIHLDVGFPPNLITEPKNTDIPLSSNGSIPCEIDGNPKPEIAWQRMDGKEIDQTRITTGTSCSLLISGAKYEDHGIYRLTAQNTFGMMEIPVKVTINGIEPPGLESTSQETKINRGDTAILPCYASGYPTPDFQWFKEDSPIAGHTENTLVLEDIQQDAAGTYKCKASNIAGNIEKVFTVVVVGKTKVKQ